MTGLDGETLDVSYTTLMKGGEARIMATVDYKAVLADLETRKAQIETMIAGVKSFIASGAASTNGSVEGVVKPEEIPSHAFLGLSIGDATKKFLDMVKSKQSLPQIMQSLERGGLPPAKYSTIYAVLRRRENQVGDIFRMGDDWALTEWYPNNPNIRRRAGGRKADTPTDAAASKKAVGSGAGSSPNTLTVTEAAKRVLTEAGKPMHLREILAGVKALGRDTTEAVLRDVMTRKDRQGNFHNLGKNTFELAGDALPLE